jgi:cellulose synthase/poly-beta-1,6-N-acetylglucosamine synthase-like glycosyltransferase
VNTILEILLFITALPAALACGYLLLMTLFSVKPAMPAPSSRRLRFDVIVPAHNEAEVIERTVASLKKIDWPAGRFRILVVADNCTDNTAILARNAGADVLERHDETRRGKGYALDFAFQTSREQGRADAVVVIDADAEVSPNLLEAFAARIEKGAHAVQAHYGVLNPWTSWRTRLITIAKAAFHIVRSRAREHLRVSCGIRGNGWCVTHDLLRAVPYRAYSLTEDIEFGIDLGLAGYRVEYAEEAHSDAEMVSNEQAAGRQRQRWESGRFQLIRSKTLSLLAAVFGDGSGVCLDLAFDLLVLPLSYVALNIMALILLAALSTFWLPNALMWLALGLACGFSLMLYVLRGWQLSGLGAQGLKDLLYAPFFLLWKVLLMFRRQRPSEWVRTQRERL